MSFFLGRHLEGQSFVKSIFLYLDCCIREDLMTENLRKPRIVVVDLCCMCKTSRETAYHLLIYCNIAKVLWFFMLCLFSNMWTIPGTVVELLACWIRQFGGL